MMVDENSLLAVINPTALLAALLTVGIIAYICARKKRNTNDFSGSVKLFVPAVLAADVLFFFLMDIPLILLAGVDLFGFVALALISNHYFYHD